MERFLQIFFIFGVITSSFSGFIPNTYFTVDKITPIIVQDYFKMIPTLYNAGQKNVTMNEDIIVEQDMPMNALCVFRVEQYMKGKYVPLGSLRKNMCDFMKNDMIFLPALAKHGNFTPRCPVKKGLYVVREFSFADVNSPIPLQPGKIRVYMEYRVAGRVSHMLLDARIVAGN